MQMGSRGDTIVLGQFVKDRDIVDADFGPLKIDREKVKKFSFSHRGSVRFSVGKYYTNEEFEERKKRVLSEPLP